MDRKKLTAALLITITITTLFLWLTREPNSPFRDSDREGIGVTDSSALDSSTDASSEFVDPENPSDSIASASDPAEQLAHLADSQEVVPSDAATTDVAEEEEFFHFSLDLDVDFPVDIPRAESWSPRTYRSLLIGCEWVSGRPTTLRAGGMVLRSRSDKMAVALMIQFVPLDEDQNVIPGHAFFFAGDVVFSLARIETTATIELPQNAPGLTCWVDLPSQLEGEHSARYKLAHINSEGWLELRSAQAYLQPIWPTQKSDAFRSSSGRRVHTAWADLSCETTVDSRGLVRLIGLPSGIGIHHTLQVSRELEGEFLGWDLLVADSRAGTQVRGRRLTRGTILVVPGAGDRLRYRPVSDLSFPPIQFRGAEPSPEELERFQIFGRSRSTTEVSAQYSNTLGQWVWSVHSEPSSTWRKLSFFLEAPGFERQRVAGSMDVTSPLIFDLHPAEASWTLTASMVLESGSSASVPIIYTYIVDQRNPVVRGRGWTDERGQFVLDKIAGTMQPAVARSSEFEIHLDANRLEGTLRQLLREKSGSLAYPISVTHRERVTSGGTIVDVSGGVMEAPEVTVDIDVWHGADSRSTLVEFLNEHRLWPQYNAAAGSR